MDYADELRNYEDEAESRYDDFDEEEGYEEEYDDEYDEFDTGLDGQDSYDDDSYEEVEYITTPGYDSYDATSVGAIDPNDRTLTISITNVSGVEAEAIIFGGNEDAAQAAGVTVTVGESSHKEVKEESKSNPFKVLGMKYSVSNSLQFDKVLRIVRKTSTGANHERVYQPRNATSPQNFSPTLIDDAGFSMDVTGQDSLRFLIMAGATAVFTFTIKVRANMGNLLRGSNVAEVSTAARITGLPQIDLARSNAQMGGPVPGQQQVVKKVRRVKKRQKAGKVAKNILMPHRGLKKLFKRKRRR
jgi:hypothetical protein